MLEPRSLVKLGGEVMRRFLEEIASSLQAGMPEFRSSGFCSLCGFSPPLFVRNSPRSSRIVIDAYTRGSISSLPFKRMKSQLLLQVSNCAQTAVLDTSRFFVVEAQASCFAFCFVRDAFCWMMMVMLLTMKIVMMMMMMMMAAVVDGAEE